MLVARPLPDLSRVGRGHALALPRDLAQGAGRVRLRPARQAVRVEGVVARAPRHGALRRRLPELRLAVEAQVVDVLLADRACVVLRLVVPRCDGVPRLGRHDRRRQERGRVRSRTTASTVGHRSVEEL